MTSQPTYREILKVCWPLALGMVNNALMQFVDRAYLARFSLSALEAVLPAGMLVWIVAGFFQSVVGYTSVFVAQYHGAGRTSMCRACVRAAMAVALVSGVLACAMVEPCDRILSLTAPFEAVGELERTYANILLCGSVFLYMQMAAAAYFTGLGLTRVVFWANLVGNVINVVLDPFFIFGWCGCPALGMAGAAYVTIGAMAVQFVILAAVLVRALRRQPPPDESERAGFALVRRMLRFGVPSALCTVLNCLSFGVFVFVTGGVGELELAVSNACFTINYLLFAPMEGVAVGVQTLVGRARGCARDDEVETALRRTLCLGLAFTAVVCVGVLAFGRPLLALFAPTEPATAARFQALGGTLLLIMTTWLLFDAANTIMFGALKGVGDTRFAMVWMLMNSFGLWLPAVFAVRTWHNTMPVLWLTLAVQAAVISVGVVLRWRRGRWRTISLIPSEAKL